MVVIGWTTWSGVITIRTSVWRANYPDADRAKIAGKLATMQAIMLAIAFRHLLLCCRHWMSVARRVTSLASPRISAILLLSAL